MRNVINSFVSHDQTAYIKIDILGTTSDDFIEYYDHIQYMHKKGLLFMADFSKAFGSLEWKIHI